MVMQFMLSDAGLATRQLIKRGASSCKTKAEQAMIKRRALICFLVLAYMIVANVGYNLWAREKSTSIWRLFSANVIHDLWTTRPPSIPELGTVTGILHSRGNSWALIGRELVREGDITHGVKIVKIDQRKVEFEKNGIRWTQKVLANPDSVWETEK